jgi:hypothetical protein
MARASSNPSSALVQSAADALRRLAGAPATAQAARAVAEEIERAWTRGPLVVGLAGDDPVARTAFLDYLAGGKLLDPNRRQRAGAPLRLRRGRDTRFRVLNQDGSVEEMALAGPEAAALRAQAGQLRTRQDELRADLLARESALERAQRAVPGPLRRRPPGWAVWTWVARWVLLLFARRKLEAQERADRQVSESRRELTGIERQVDERLAQAQALETDFVSRLRAALRGGDGMVGQVELTVAGGTLAEGLEVVDAGGGGESDALLVVAGDQVFLHTGGGERPRNLGDFAQAAGSLPTLIATERALALARRARERIAAGAAAIDEAIERAEGGFATRIERLEAMRLADRDGFMAAQLDRVRPLVTERVHMTIEQATVHLGMEVERLGSEWSAAIAQAESSDDLRAAASRIDDTSPAALQELAKEVRLLVAIALNGSAHDLFPEIVSELRKLGMPQEVAQPPKLSLPVPAPVEVVPSLAASDAHQRVGGSARWLSALFRSLDTRRSDALERIEQRRGRLRDLTMSEILDSEPQLSASLSGALGMALAGALDRYDEWLTTTMASERLNIERDRDALSPLRQVRDSARRDDRHLGELMSQLEAEVPVERGPQGRPKPLSA